ncbi:transposase [Streptomyces phaeochromogenes]|uniref:transposase n=1 Tax=Streptomyces phaeochromogenes TaxID=1923 RepID=UPI0033F0B6AF
MDAAITELAAQPAWAPAVRRLACMRGVSTFIAFGLAVEIGDWHRFTGSTIGSYLGLVPSEDSFGSQRRQGGITKTGNTPCPPAPGGGRLAPPPSLPTPRRRSPGPPRPRRRPCPAARRTGQPTPAPALGEPGRPSQTLHISVVAVARELSDRCWSLAIMED